MFPARITLTAAALSLAFMSACSPAPDRAEVDAEFAALQLRGAAGMGVDQYASTHLFDALPDGGRIEFQYSSDDPAEVAAIRRHLHEIHAAFAAGDFSIPAFVHDQTVPGTQVMAARRDHISYLYSELPRGGELRLVTSDPEALEAISAFMAFQRDDHRAGGMDHSIMDHTTMDHSTMDHSAMSAATPSAGAMDHSAMDHSAMDHSAMGRSGMMAGGAGMQRDFAGRRAHHLEMGDGDEAFADDMEIIHQLLTNHQAITRTVEHLPNGIRTLTQSDRPAVAQFLVAHVASMERRLEAGEEFNLFSETIPVLFENYDQIQSEFRYSGKGVEVIQTSDIPELVAALQAHAAEVTELADEGMMAMMRGMMSVRRGGMMRGMMGGGMGGMMQGGQGGPGGHAAPGGMHGNMGGMPGHGTTPEAGTP